MKHGTYEGESHLVTAEWLWALKSKLGGQATTVGALALIKAAHLLPGELAQSLALSRLGL